MTDSKTEIYNTNDTTPIVLIKYGGNAMINEKLQNQILENICALKEKKYDVVIVHGGGHLCKKHLMK